MQTPRIAEAVFEAVFELAIVDGPSNSELLRAVTHADRGQTVLFDTGDDIFKAIVHERAEIAFTDRLTFAVKGSLREAQGRAVRRHLRLRGYVELKQNNTRNRKLKAVPTSDAGTTTIRSIRLSTAICNEVSNPGLDSMAAREARNSARSVTRFRGSPCYIREPRTIRVPSRLASSAFRVELGCGPVGLF